MGISYRDPDTKPGVHVAQNTDNNLFFPRWLFNSGDSQMSDESFAATCNMGFDDYKLKMMEYGAVEQSSGMYFKTWLECKKFVDDIIQPAVLLKQLERVSV